MDPDISNLIIAVVGGVLIVYMIYIVRQIGEIRTELRDVWKDIQELDDYIQPVSGKMEGK